MTGCIAGGGGTDGGGLEGGAEGKVAMAVVCMVSIGCVEIGIGGGVRCSVYRSGQVRSFAQISRDCDWSNDC